jgi:hypothetical protein
VARITDQDIKMYKPETARCLAVNFADRFAINASEVVLD